MRDFPQAGQQPTTSPGYQPAFLLFLLGSLFLHPAIFAGDPPTRPLPLPAQLDLTAAKRIALRDNPGVKALLERVRVAEATIGQARAATRPGLDGEADYTRLHDVPWAAGNLDNTSLYRVGLAAQWLVFDSFATRFRVEAAKAGVEASLADWRDGRRLLAAGVADAFFTCLLADAAVEIAARNAEFNRSLLNEARKRYAAGSGPKVDVLNFQVRLREAENAVLGSRQATRTSRQVLAALLGLPEAAWPPRITLIPPDIGAFPPLPEETQALNRAYRQRQDLLAYEQAIQQVQAGARATRHEGYPKLSVHGDYGFERADDLHFDRDENASSSVGVRLAWNLFDGGLRSHTVAELKARARALDRQRDQLRLDIARDVRNAMDLSTTRKLQADNQRDIAGMFKEIRDLVRKQYLSGSASLTRVNEAQTDLVTAEAQLARMQFLALQAMENFSATLGENLPPEKDGLTRETR